MIGRERFFTDIKKIILKIGTSSLTNEDGSFNRKLTVDIANQVALLGKFGKEMIIVSSGAIGIGCEELKISRPESIPLKQAAAAVGQNILMKEWSNAFEKYNIKVGQILLTYDSLCDPTMCTNLKNSISELFNLGVVPIINENDPICIYEIGNTFGDNDNLSAMLASKIEAKLLIILSDIDGLYTKDPRRNNDGQLISIVNKITPNIEKYCEGPNKGVGGMITKLCAARLASEYGCFTVIANSDIENVVMRILEGENIGTLFALNQEKCDEMKMQ